MPGKRANGSAKPARLAEVTGMADRVDRDAPVVGSSSSDSVTARKLLLSVEEAMGVLDYTRPRLYRAINNGDIEVLKDNKRTRIPYASCVAYVRNLCQKERLSADVISLIG